MQVAVIGAGLAGLTTAYFLSQQGVDVTVIDRGKLAASETSHANGSMLTPSLADPWNAPGVLRQLVNSLGREDSSMLLRLKAVPSLMGWGLKFLAHANRKSFEHSFRENAQFAVYSASVMQDLLQRHPFEFEYAPDGTIKVFRDKLAFEQGQQTARWLKGLGIESELLDPGRLLERESALEATIGDFAGGIHYRRDEIGNARLFCYELQNVCENNGVKFLFEHALTSVIRRAGKIYALQTVDANDEINNIEIDAVVIAAGSYSWPLGKLFGLSVPVRPAKGYSLTVPLDQSEIKPRYAIVDDALHAAIVPLAGDKLRLAGTAEFAGFDTTLSPQRAANLAQFLGRVYPNVKYDPAMVIPWCGLRPMTSDGRPIIGRSSIANVFLNTGHGPLGWTLACGSGKVLADEIVGNPPTYDIKAFSPSR